jgi:hypothetical protein
MSLLDKKEPNQEVESSRKINWMKSELGLISPFKNPLDGLHRTLGFKVSDFKLQVCRISVKELNA